MPFPPRGPPEVALPALVNCAPNHHYYSSPSSSLESNLFVKQPMLTNQIPVKCEVDIEVETDQLSLEKGYFDGDKSLKAKQEKAKTEGKEAGRNPFLVILTAEQARSIYCLRSLATAQGPGAHLVAGKSSLVAEMYGVSPKTIRDVWNRKTWTQITRSLWSEQEADLYTREHMTPEQRAAIGDTEQLMRKRGRPPGSKDARPRKRRVQGVDDAIEQHALQQGTLAFLENLASSLSNAPRSVGCVPSASSSTASIFSDDAHDDEKVTVTDIEEPAPELHGPCDRFSGLAQKTSHSYISQNGEAIAVEDEPTSRPNIDTRYGHVITGKVECLCASPVTEDPEPSVFDSESCGRTPAGSYRALGPYGSSHGGRQDCKQAQSEDSGESGPVIGCVNGLFPDDDDCAWFPGAAMPDETPGSAPSGGADKSGHSGCDEGEGSANMDGGLASWDGTGCGPTWDEEGSTNGCSPKMMGSFGVVPSLGGWLGVGNGGGVTGIGAGFVGNSGLCGPGRSYTRHGVGSSSAAVDDWASHDNLSIRFQMTSEGSNEGSGSGSWYSVSSFASGSLVQNSPTLSSCRWRGGMGPIVSSYWPPLVATSTIAADLLERHLPISSASFPSGPLMPQCGNGFGSSVHGRP